MGQILHGSAETTHVVRAAIQRSKASIKELAARTGRLTARTHPLPVSNLAADRRRDRLWSAPRYSGPVKRVTRAAKHM